MKLVTSTLLLDSSHVKGAAPTDREGTVKCTSPGDSVMWWPQGRLEGPQQKGQRRAWWSWLSPLAFGSCLYPQLLSLLIDGTYPGLYLAGDTCRKGEVFGRCALHPSPSCQHGLRKIRITLTLENLDGRCRPDACAQ